MIPLFDRFPRLAEALPYVPLGNFPTPVERCDTFGVALGHDAIYIKRDDVSGEPYGGNKVRKLEFLLGKAMRDKRREVLTFGYAGSNHCLATAIYARELGLGSISMLLPQPPSQSLRRNLLLSHAVGAELHHYSSRPAIVCGTLLQLARHQILRGKAPQMIPAGGSSPLGVTGFVNAAFELRNQVDAGLCPEPDLLYVAVGSMGSAAGLLIGLKAAGLKTRLTPVRVIETGMASPEKLARLIARTQAFLRDRDPAFPTRSFVLADCLLRDEYFGDGYGQFTPEDAEAIALIDQTQHVHLEGTYTGKTLAALIGDARRGALAGKTVLFWDTYNSRPVWDATGHVDYHILPGVFHRYFEGALQSLDTQPL